MEEEIIFSEDDDRAGDQPMNYRNVLNYVNHNSCICIQ